MLDLQETVGPAADDFGDRLERRFRRQTGRHDCRHVAAGPGERLRQVRERPLQAEAHGAVVLCRQLVGRVHQHVCEDHARRGAADAGDNVARQHRLVVMEAQTVTQLEGPGQSVLLDDMTLDHLRLRLPLGVDAVERVEHEIGGISRRPKSGHHRVKHAQIGDPDENQGFRAIRTPPEPWRHAGHKRRRGTFKQVTSSHSGVSPDSQNSRPISMNSVAQRG